MSGAAIWYVVRNGNVLGPLSFAELLSDAREGRLSPDDPVWTVGMAEWATAREVPGLWMPPKLPEPALAPEAEEEDVLDLTLEEAISPAPEAAAVAVIAQERPGKPRAKRILFCVIGEGNFLLDGHTGAWGCSSPLG
jgi:hypothetical protein